MVEQAVKNMLGRLRINAGVARSPAGGTGLSGQKYITADAKKVFIDGSDYKV